MTILDVKNLNVWDERNGEKIVSDLSFSVREHTCLALVGESGSGKSMTIKSICGINKPWLRCSGEAIFSNENILSMEHEKLRHIRGKEIFMIFQDAMSAFDPSCTIKNTLRDILCENINCNKTDADECMISSMKKLLLKNPEEILNKYPHQLSGGMLQRIMIALAIVLQPKLLIADEPTTSLDTITQYAVIQEFMEVKKKYGTSMIFISHDLGVVRKLADDIVVMQNGKKVEEGSTADLISDPKDEYTKLLVNTRKKLGENYRKLLMVK